ncbi:MAG: acyltransferase [Nanoarchaeota archaeon]|nr:N-acetyltransferase [Nanoarchaeota archaeon]
MIHLTAEVSPKAKIGENVKIWNQAQVREDSIIGDNSIISKNVYIDSKVKVGKNCKIQNNSSIYHGVTIEDCVFIGPHCILTNDKLPRAITINGNLKNDRDWKEGKILVKTGSSLGAGVIVLPDLTIGKFAMIGVGSVVTKDVPDFGLVYGNPARLHGYVCKCGSKLEDGKEVEENCKTCQENMKKVFLK